MTKVHLPHPTSIAPPARVWLAALALGGVFTTSCVEPPDRPPPTSSASVSAAPPVPSAPPAPSAEAELVPARGPTRLLPSRPEGLTRVCSFTRPVCVHHAPDAAVAVVSRALSTAERTLEGLAALRLASPRPDFAQGGGPELDVYLTPDSERAHAVVDLEVVDRTWDLAAAFVLAPPPERGGCAADAALALAIAEAALLGLDAGVERDLAHAIAGHLASLVIPCAAAEIAAIDELQRMPERGLDAPPGSSGGRLFFAWLEERHGSGRPGELATALVAAAPQRTPPSSAWFRNEPDLVDVLQGNARAGGSPPFGEMLRDFAVARAFVGSRSDDMHLRDVARFGDMGRVRFDWSVTYASLPRRLAPARPVLPTGASYVWIDLSEAPGGVPLTVVAEWEPPVVFRWAIVKVGPEGDARGVLEPPTRLGETTIQQSLVDLHGLAGLIVVGVNEGGSSAIDHHDPDDGPFLGQGYTLTLYPQ